MANQCEFIDTLGRQCCFVAGHGGGEHLFAVPGIDVSNEIRLRILRDKIERDEAELQDPLACIGRAEGALLMAARAAKVNDSIAAHDCYQLALQALDPVRAAIERAREGK